MIRRLVSIVTAGLLFMAVLVPASQARGPKPSPDPSLTVALVCDWEPVPEGGWPPIPAPHLDAIVTWSDIGNGRKRLSITAGDYRDGERREWGGHWSQLQREPSGSRDLHLDVWIDPGDRVWATATIGGHKGVLVSADAEITC